MRLCWLCVSLCDVVRGYPDTYNMRERFFWCYPPLNISEKCREFQGRCGKGRKSEKIFIEEKSEIGIDNGGKVCYNRNVLWSFHMYTSLRAYRFSPLVRPISFLGEVFTVGRGIRFLIFLIPRNIGGWCNGNTRHFDCRY